MLKLRSRSYFCPTLHILLCYEGQRLDMDQVKRLKKCCFLRIGGRVRDDGTRVGEEGFAAGLYEHPVAGSVRQYIHKIIRNHASETAHKDVAGIAIKVENFQKFTSVDDEQRRVFKAQCRRHAPRMIVD